MCELIPGSPPPFLGSLGMRLRHTSVHSLSSFFTLHRCDQLTGDAPGEAEAWASAGLFET